MSALVAERSLRELLKKVSSVRTRRIERRLVLGLVRICLVRSGLSNAFYFCKQRWFML
jgi:hypothetical protein